MKKNRRVFSSEFKSKVVLESLKERETLASLAKKFEIHPQQITDWKQRFLSGLRDFFGEGKSTEKSESEQEQLVSGLYEKIGRLEVENEFLKKKLKQT
ncbi:MAG TPA: transposase [Bacteroidia bacterium]|nr:transposase [Bacteroidia bacterium]